LIYALKKIFFLIMDILYAILNPSFTGNSIVFSPQSKTVYLILISYISLIFSSLILKFSYDYQKNYLELYLSSNSLVILATIVFAIVNIIQDSITLSLGMVGALSIVRFRTPVKSSFDLIYLFAAIAIGVAYGSGQVLLAIIFSLLIILSILVFLKKKTSIIVEKKLGIFNLELKSIEQFNDLNKMFKFVYAEYSDQQSIFQIENNREEFLDYLNKNKIKITSLIEQ
jgi:hypothetical protein